MDMLPCRNASNTRVSGSEFGFGTQGKAIRTEKSGFALISTLWVMAVLGVMAASLAFETQCESRTLNWADRNQRNYNLARAGVHLTAGLIREHAQDNTHSLHDKWFSGPSMYKQMRFDKGYYTILRHDTDMDTESRVQGDRFNEDTREPRFGLDDEESRININIMDMYQLARLPHVSEVLAADVIQYVIERKEALQKLNYRRRHNGLREIKDEPGMVTLPIRRIEELLMVDGMTEEMLFGTIENPGGLAQYLTCYSSGKVNLNTASSEVYRAIGFHEQQVRFCNEYRWGNAEGFASVDEAYDLLGLKDEYLKKILSTSSRNFRIHCVAGFNRDKPEKRIRARLTVGESDIRFTMWESESIGDKSPKEI